MNVTADLLRSLGCNRAQFDARCEEIAALLERSDKAVEAAIVRIYDRQTRDEKSSEATVHHNGIGFQACDARRGTYWARLILSGRHLFADRMPKARQMTVKYRRQLAVLSFEKDRAKRQATVAVAPETCRECGVVKCPDGCCCGC